MRLLRFHLSTLLLTSVFAGSAIGLSLTPAVWEPVKDMEPHIQNYSNNVNWGDYPEAVDGVTVNRDSPNETHSKINLNFVPIDAATKVETKLYTLECAHGFCSYGFSNDGKLFAILGPGGPEEIYRRTRSYGIKGWMELPLTWIALVSFLGLCAVLARRIRARFP